jgi:hypothetical protein
VILFVKLGFVEFVRSKCWKEGGKQKFKKRFNEFVLYTPWDQNLLLVEMKNKALFIWSNGEKLLISKKYCNTNSKITVRSRRAGSCSSSRRAADLIPCRGTKLDSTIFHCQVFQSQINSLSVTPLIASVHYFLSCFFYPVYFCNLSVVTSSGRHNSTVHLCKYFCFYWQNTPTVNCNILSMTCITHHIR